MKRVLAVLVCFVLVCTMISPVFAAPFANSSSALTASATQLKRGDTFTIVATLTNTEAIKMGSVYLDFNSAAFEVTGGATLVTSTMGAMATGGVVPADNVGTFIFLNFADPY